jgi:DNA-directed RNA polymerase specialized sigma24 family protein
MADRAETVDPGLSTSTTQAIAAVRRAIPQLSPPDQIMIMLRNYEQRSVQDTAAILDITSDACRQRHLRALRRLKVILAADPHARRLMGDRE